MIPYLSGNKVIPLKGLMGEGLASYRSLTLNYALDLKFIHSVLYAALFV